MNIPNIYNALGACGMKQDLASDIHIACVQMGWPADVQSFVVQRGPTIQNHEVAIALCISTRARESLLTPESVAAFDRIIAEAQGNWVALNKSNKVSRILTDYLKA